MGSLSLIFCLLLLSCISGEEENKEEHGRLTFIRKALQTVGKGVKYVHDKVDQRLNSTFGISTKKSLSSQRKLIQAIVPGTKWCGDGDRAKNSVDLGRFKKADDCCRNHDLCPDFIPAGETKFGLKNTGLFTRSSCKCDEAFYQCLKEAHNVIALQIGTVYFTLLGPQCFKEVPSNNSENQEAKWSNNRFVFL